MRTCIDGNSSSEQLCLQAGTWHNPLETLRSFLRQVLCVLFLTGAGVAGAAEFSLSKLFAGGPRELAALGFEPIGTMPDNVPWLNYERIGWLYSAHTGKVPNYAEYIMNGEYLEKGTRQIPQFCQLNRLRFAVCEFMRTSHPKFLADYKAIATEGIEAAKTQNEFFMAGADFRRVNSYDMTTGGLRIEFEGVNGGIVIGSSCWFSHSQDAPHACINIDNIKSVNNAVLPIPPDPRLGEKLKENSRRGEYFLVMKVRVRAPFSSTVLYKRSNYMLGGSTALYTAWVVATNIYLVDKEGNIYHDITILNDSSEKDRIDADLSKKPPAVATFVGRHGTEVRPGSKVIQVALDLGKPTSTGPGPGYTSLMNTLCLRHRNGEIAVSDHSFLESTERSSAFARMSGSSVLGNPVFCARQDGSLYGDAPLTKNEVEALRAYCEMLATKLKSPTAAKEYKALGCE